MPLNKKSLHAVIEQCLARGGQQLAVEDAEEAVDYAELEKRSRQLACQLQTHGVGPGVIVALPLPASLAYVVAMLATIRAGGIFMPIDPAFPSARLQRIFAQACPRVIVVLEGEEALAGRLAEQLPAASGVAILTLAAAAVPCAERAESAPLPVRAADDDTGYLIHTSGSTGEPKLIAGRNKGVSHFIHWEVAELALPASVRGSFLAPPGFDVSLREILVPLLAGGTVVIPAPAVRQDAGQLLSWLRTQDISLLHCVPSLFRLLTRALRDQDGTALPALDNVCLAGEPLYGADVAAWRSVAGNGAQLINLYGPSETTLAKAFHRVDRETYAPGAIVPIGQPIANTALLILRDGRLADMGELGEIYIRTPFCSNGYWQDAARSAEAFVPNPLSDDPDDRIYRTGDLGRYRPDRSVEFVGRADRQVKVDGVRIELNEIEGALRAHPHIEEAAAQVFRLGDGSAQLVAYYALRAASPASDTPLDAMVVRAHLARTLPVAMLPGHLVALPTLPKGLNGKLDRKALPRPDSLLAQDDEVPQGEVETALASLWAEALGVSRIGVERPWVSAGGNSLRAIGLISRINHRFGAALTIRDFFAHGTIRSQARVLAARRATGLPALQRVAEQADYPLTEAQQRLWIVSQLAQAEHLYNNLEWLTFEGPLQLDALRQAFAALVARHESLRTVFFSAADGSARQRVLEQVDLPWQVIEAGALSPAEQQTLLEAEIERERARLFDLQHGPLLQLTVVRCSAQCHHMLINIHHIACDGWSMSRLNTELAQAYRAYVEGAAPDWALPNFRPRDLAHWQQQHAQLSALQQAEAYWHSSLDGVAQRARLAPDGAQPEYSDTQATRMVVPLDAAQVQRARPLLAERQVTPFMVVAAALAVLVQRYGGRSLVVLGTPVAGREIPGSEELVTFCVNTLPLVLRVDGEHSFAALLDQTRDALADLHAHQAISFERLVAQQDVAHDPQRNPLFEVFLAIEPAAQDPGLPELTVYEHEVPNPPARYDLSLRFADDGEQWRLILEYRSSLWQRATMAAFSRHLGTVLAQVLTQLDTPVGRLDMLAPEERARVLAWSSGAQQAWPHPTVPAWFAEVATAQPDAPALWLAEALDQTPVAVSYAELARRADAVSAALMAAGVRAGEVVAVLLPRGAAWPAALLGIMQMGAVALPLDPRHPTARLAWLVEDAEAVVVLAPERLHPELLSPTPAEASARRCVRLDPERLSASAENGSGVTLAPQGPAYLIYTSGSTGEPKGVLVSHKALSNMLHDHVQRLQLSTADRVLQFVAPAFDAALFEALAPLVSGAALAIPPREAIEDSQAYGHWVTHLQASIVMMTPGFLATLPEPLPPSLRVVLTGGEPPQAADASRCRRAGIRYINAYGPTEAAVNAAAYEVDALATLEPIPLGAPTANTSLHVRAPDGSLLPTGVAGELWISGVGVALGYVRRPDLTQRVFCVDEAGQRAYRSGDWVRRAEDGNLYFVGREDAQVKVRGHRIEPAEVSTAVRAVPGVAAAHVVARPQGRDHVLLAYWVAAAGAEIDSQLVREALAQRLPAYAVPSHFVALPQLPLTLNGKVDAARLPEPDVARDTGAPPQSAAEAALVAVWREVLGLPDSADLGRDSDFFVLGGRSLAANRLAMRASQVLQRPVNLRDVYAAPTPAGLLAHLGAQAQWVLPQLAEDAPAPLSPMQRRLWVISQLGVSGGVYHIAGWTRLEGDFDIAAFTQALADLCARQAVLRTRIVCGEHGEPWQHVDPCTAPPVSVQTHDAAADSAGLTESIAKCAAAPFDLAREWPVRVAVWHSGVQCWDVLVVLHHLAADGWSMPIFTAELAQAYNARRQGQEPDWMPLPAHYRQLAVWQREQGIAPEDVAYWRAQLAGPLPVLDLPCDFPRPVVRRFQGRTWECPVAVAAFGALQQLAERHGTSQFTVFLATLQLLLARLARQGDVIVGVPVAGRSHPDSAGLIGFFVNTLALRARLVAGQSLSDHVHVQAAQLVAAQQHVSYPFEQLVEDLQLAHDTGRSPVFDVLASWDEASAHNVQFDGVCATPQRLPRQGSRCDMWWMVDCTAASPVLRIEYDSDLFTEATIAEWGERWMHMVQAAAHAPDTPWSELDWLLPTERADWCAQVAEAARGAAPSTTVLARFEAFVAETPQALALVGEGGAMSYAQLDGAAKCLAQQLRAQFDDRNQGQSLARPLVALLLARGRAMAVAQLAVLKAGAAYVPLEPEAPAARQLRIVEDACPVVLIHDTANAPPAGCSCPCLVVDANGQADPALPQAGLPTQPLSANDPIYVMYTSGSTGEPKGVVVLHQGVSRLVIESDYYQPQPHDRILQLSNYAFDGATFDFYAAFANGLPLCVPDRETVLDSARLAAFIERHRVNVSFMTTALFNRLVDEQPQVLKRFRRLYFGGQVASLAHVRRAASLMEEAALVHVYGPTETTTFALWHPVNQDDVAPNAGYRLPIGRSIAHTTAWVVDEHGAYLPPGVIGELWIGGPGVAQGYLGQPTLSAQRFVTPAWAPDQRLYRSGDLCLRRRDGVIEFIGRDDGMVKVRGYRVELGELENALVAVTGVEQACVLARVNAQGNNELLAYLQLESEGPAPSLAELHQQLTQTLPVYMVPAQVAVVPVLPLTPNGKVDRAALPPPEECASLARGDCASASDQAPSDPAQAALWTVWREVLRLSELGVYDNYFALGGDSIQALQISSRLRSLGWRLQVTDLLRMPTIATLAPHVSPLGEAEVTVVVRAEEEAAPPLSPMQHWFLAQDFAQPQHFNQSVLVQLDAELAPQRLQHAMEVVWQQHAALRLVLEADEAGALCRQRVCALEGGPQVLSVRCADAAALLEDAQQRQRGFDLQQGPLFAAVRYHLPEGDRLLFLAHHWVMDGVSWRTVLEDLAACLAGRSLMPVPATPAHWAAALAKLDISAAEQQWWHMQAQAEALALPSASSSGSAAPRSALAERAHYAFVVSASASAALTSSGHLAYRTQGDELLLAAWVLALQRSLGAPSHVLSAVRLALESHGRTPLPGGVDISRTVGWFTALFPLRIALSSLDLRILIREVKEAVRAVPQRGVGYGVLKWLRRDPVLLAAPALEMGFNYLGRFDQDAALPVASEACGDDLAQTTRLPHGVDVTAELRGEQLHVRLVADTQRHPEAWCAALSEAFAAALEEVAAHCADPSSGGLSPSDVDFAGIGLDDLDAILDGLGQA